MANENFMIRYTLNDDEKNDTLLNLEMSFDNPSPDLLVKRLNTWLKAIGREQLEVSFKTLFNPNIVIKKEPGMEAMVTTTTTKSVTTTKFNNATKRNEDEVIIIE